MQRRTFLTGAAAAINGLIAFLLAVPAVRFVLTPLRRKPKEAAFVRVAPLSALAGGRPVRVTVFADRWDAFVHHPPGPIGGVWLVGERTAQPSPSVRCLQAVCPHLGCGIEYDAGRREFNCPCHASRFDATGRRLNSVSPRDMDELLCRVTPPDDQGRRWIEIRYQEFRPGTSEPRSVT